MIEILYFIPILLSAYAIGFNIFRLFKLKSTHLEESIFSIVLGFAFYSYFTFFLGILGWLYAWIYWIVILLSLVLWHKLWIEFIKSIFSAINNFKPKYNFETFLIVVIAIFVVLAILSTLVPPFLWDEMDYQLALPKIWVRHHELIPVYSRWVSELPSNVNMLYIIGLLLKNGILSKFFALSYGLMLAGSVYSFGKKYYSKRIALLAASSILTLPMIMNHIGSAYVDIPVASMVFLALYSFIAWLDKLEIKWMYLSAVLTGLSSASKHTAMFPTAILGIFVMFFALRKMKFASAVKCIFAFGAITLMFLLPWYLKSYIHTGNPVWPLAYNIFGGKYWDSILASEFSKGTNIISDYGLSYFVSLPWNIAMHSSSFSLLLGWNFIFLAFVPLLIFYRKIDKRTLMLLFYSLIFLYAVVFASYYLFGLQMLRYILIYQVFAIISGVVISNLYEQQFFRKFLAVSLIVTFAFTAVLWLGVFGSKIPYVFGFETDAGFYNKLIDYNGYPVFEYINKNLPKDSIIFIFRDSRGYLSNRDYIVGLPSDQKIVDYSKIKNEDDFYNQLKQNKVTHILINTNIEFYKPQPVVKRRQEPFSQEHQDFMDRLLAKKAVLLIEYKGVYLYRLY